MPSYYTYLISSLPYLIFNSSPPFSLEDFFDTCLYSVSKVDLRKVKEAVTASDYQVSLKDTPLLREWHHFNLVLRNELVRARSARMKADPLKYLRNEAYFSAAVRHVAMTAYRNQNILEAEKSLDLERWRFLDEVSAGHYFDIDSLIVYALKLKILIRWDKVYNTNSEMVLKAALGRN
ncbi:MAG: DUF2764 family protein [Candidatus Omnitrophica bacterium]|jgi:hypothetical protein|nr:DUF2764 family protein [Candidatus Omnitrophota bacterium]MDD3987603.1 DUF2764 family protein [Candidatus Omnitrophota bacterium]MDD4981365.1 DUF2764 family protein [Candidatus Omnitrophota bacterium]